MVDRGYYCKPKLVGATVTWASQMPRLHREVLRLRARPHMRSSSATHATGRSGRHGLAPMVGCRADVATHKHSFADVSGSSLKAARPGISFRSSTSTVGRKCTPESQTAPCGRRGCSSFARSGSVRFGPSLSASTCAPPPRFRGSGSQNRPHRRQSPPAILLPFLAVANTSETGSYTGSPAKG